ncbi:MAG: hypothetical protein R3A49_14370 [Acidimicrobiia bacterium]
MTETREENREEVVCPQCGGPVVRIAYGLPGREMWRDAEAGHIVLGGCCVDFFSPTHHCFACHVDIGPDERVQPRVREKLE